MIYNCLVCKSPKRDKIESDLLNRVPYKVISEKYNIMYGPLKRHEKKHISSNKVKIVLEKTSKALVPNFDLKKDLPRVDNFKGTLSFIHDELLEMYMQAKKDNDKHLARLVLREARECTLTAMKAQELWLSYQAQGSWEVILPRILQAVEYNQDAKIAIKNALSMPIHKKEVV